MIKIPEKFIREAYAKDSLCKNPAAYFYDLAIIRDNIRRLQNFLPAQTKLYYAMKANPHDAVLDCVCNEDFITGIEIASAGELKAAGKFCAAGNIIFTGPGKTEYELEEAIRSGIRLINVESLAEAVRIDQITRRLGMEKVDVLLRVNLDFPQIDGAENMTGYSTKMGVDEKDFVETYKEVCQLEGVRVKGIHAFAASGVLDDKILLRIDEYIFDFVEKLQSETGEVSVIDFGGGLGIDYLKGIQQFDVEHYGKELEGLIERHGFGHKEIIMELGTYLVGNAGYYTSEIIDIKEIKGKKHIIIAGGINHMGLPLEMRRQHPVALISRDKPKLYAAQPSVRSETADISGPLCIVSDKLSWDVQIEKADIGDIVVYTQAGAYCYGEGLVDFLMHERPFEIVFDSQASVG